MAQPVADKLQFISIEIINASSLHGSKGIQMHKHSSEHQFQFI